MASNIELKGLDGVLAAFDKLQNAEKLKKQMEEATLLVEKSAKENCPKDNGALRRSIESSVDESTGEIKGIVGTPLEYAPYVNYGTGIFAAKGNGRKSPWSYQDDKGNWHTTSGQHPQPFMTNAFEQNRQQIINLLKEGLKND